MRLEMEELKCDISMYNIGRYKIRLTFVKLKNTRQKKNEKTENQNFSY